MSYLESVFFSLSVFIPGAISIVKIRNADKAFYPFILCIWLACANEVISLIMAFYHLNTAVNNNIYVLVETLLIGWQFKNWGLFQNLQHAFLLFTGFIVTLWVIEFYTLDRLQIIGAEFRIICSFLIVMISIYLNCRLIYTYEGKLEKSPVFIIGTGLILYFTFKIFIEVFLIYGLTASPSFYGDLFFILSCVNVVTNLLYSIALLCIPKKIYYTDPY